MENLVGVKAPGSLAASRSSKQSKHFNNSFETWHGQFWNILHLSESPIACAQTYCLLWTMGLRAEAKYLMAKGCFFAQIGSSWSDLFLPQRKEIDLPFSLKLTHSGLTYFFCKVLHILVMTFFTQKWDCRLTFFAKIGSFWIDLFFGKK